MGVKGANVNHGAIFSHSSMVLQAAIYGQGVALVNSVMAQPDIDAGRLISPFEHALISKSSFYIVCREAQVDIGKISSFREWVLDTVDAEEDVPFENSY